MWTLQGSTSAWAAEDVPNESAIAEGDEEAIKDKARKLWREGLAASEANDLEFALARFRESFALYPHLETLRNLAVVEIAFDEHVAEGANHLAYYLAHTEELQASERPKVEALLVKTEERVGRLDIDIAPPDSILELDGERVQPPLAGRVLYVLPGKHDIMAWRPDSTSVKRSLELRPGQRKDLSITLRAAKRRGPTVTPRNETRPSTPSTAPASAASEHWPDAKLWTVVGGATLTALAVGVGVYGEVALMGAKDDVKKAGTAVDQAFDGNSPCFDGSRSELSVCRSLDNATKDKDSAAWTANAGWIAASALAGATAAAWLLWPNDPGGSGPRQDAGITTAAPWVSSRTAGWAVSGRF